jgi:hypothetical protein
MITKRILSILYLTLLVFNSATPACLDTLKDFGFKVLDEPVKNENFTFCKDVYELHGACVDINTIKDFFHNLKIEKTRGFLEMLGEINNNLDQYDVIIGDLLDNYLKLSDQQKIMKTEKENMVLKLSKAKEELKERELPLDDELYLNPRMVVGKLFESLSGNIEMKKASSQKKELELEIKQGQELIDELKEMEIENSKDLEYAMGKLDRELVRIENEFEFLIPKEKELANMILKVKQTLEGKGVIEPGTVLIDPTELPQDVDLTEILPNLDEVANLNYEESEKAKEVKEMMIREALGEMEEGERKEEMIKNMMEGKKPELTEEEKIIYEDRKELLLEEKEGKEAPEENDFKVNIGSDDNLIEEFQNSISRDEEKDDEIITQPETKNELDDIKNTETNKDPKVDSNTETKEDPKVDSNTEPTNTETKEDPKVDSNTEPTNTETKEDPKVESNTETKENTSIEENKETTNTETTNTESSNTEPTKTEPTKTEPTNTEPTNNEPTNNEPTNNEPTNTEPTNTEPTNTEPTNTEPTNNEPTNTEPTNTEPTNTEPTNTETNNNEPTNTETNPDSRFANRILEESKLEFLNRTLREVRHKMSKLKEHYKAVESLEEMLIKKYEDSMKSEMETSIEEITTSTEPLDIFSVFRSDFFSMLKEDLSEDIGNLKREVVDFMKKVGGFRKNVNEMEGLLESQEEVDKIVKFMAFGEGEEVDEDKIKSMMEEFQTKTLADHLKDDPVIVNAARMLFSFGDVLGDQGDTLDNLVKDTINTTLNDTQNILGDTQNILTDTLDSLNIENIIKNELQNQLNDLPEEFKDFIPKDFNSLSVEEMREAVKVAPVKVIESRMKELYDKNMAKMKTYQMTMKERLTKIEELLEALLNKMIGMHKADNSSRLQMFTEISSKISTAETNLRQRLKELIGKFDSATEADMLDALKYKIYMLKILLQSMKDVKEKIMKLKTDAETGKDLETWEPILRREAKQLVHELAIDFEDSLWILKKVELNFDTDGVDDMSDLDENIAKLKMLSEMLKFKEDFKAKYRDKEFRNKTLEPLIKMAAGTMCSITAGNASDFFTRNSDGTMMVPIGTTALDFISKHSLSMVNIICVAISPMKMIFEVLEEFPPESMTGYLDMCSYVEELSLCETDFSQCPQEIKEKIITFFDSPLGENKMKNIKLGNIKDNSDKVVIKMNELKSKMDIGESKVGKIEEISNSVKVEIKGEGNNINIRDGKIEINEKHDPEFAAGEEGKEAYMDKQMEDLKKELNLLNPDPLSARRLQETTSTTNNESQYVYTTGDTVNIVAIAEQAGLDTSEVESTLENIPTLSQEEAENFLTNNSTTLQDLKDLIDHPDSVTRMMTGILSLFVLTFFVN